jgi:hypothetical protein
VREILTGVTAGVLPTAKDVHVSIRVVDPDVLVGLVRPATRVEIRDERVGSRLEQCLTDNVDRRRLGLVAPDDGLDPVTSRCGQR